MSESVSSDVRAGAAVAGRPKKAATASREPKKLPVVNQSLPVWLEQIGVPISAEFVVLARAAVDNLRKWVEGEEIRLSAPSAERFRPEQRGHFGVEELKEYAALCVRSAGDLLTRNWQLHWKEANDRAEKAEAVLEKICAEAESWHTMHDHGSSSAHCDSICALIPEMRAAIRAAKEGK